MKAMPSSSDWLAPQSTSFFNAVPSDISQGLSVTLGCNESVGDNRLSRLRVSGHLEVPDAS
jgi:hypothetical protein